MKKLLINLLIIVMLGIATPHIYLYVERMYYPVKYKDTIKQFSVAHKLDPALTASLIYHESRFNPEASSRKGAVGLMQVMPQTGEWVAKKIGLPPLEPSSLYDPQLNIRLGTWYLAYLIEMFNDERVALVAYNAGMRTTRKWLENKGVSDSSDPYNLDDFPFPETRSYVKSVESTSETYRRLYPELK